MYFYLQYIAVYTKFSQTHTLKARWSNVLYIRVHSVYVYLQTKYIIHSIQFVASFGDRYLCSFINSKLLILYKAIKEF